jgi:arsenate reductase
MAEGFLRKKFEGKDFQIFSAGIGLCFLSVINITEIQIIEAHGMNQMAVNTMKEVGIDISSHSSKTVNSLNEIKFDILMTVCNHAEQNCPHSNIALSRYHYDIPDPAKFKSTNSNEVDQEFRRVRDIVEKCCDDIYQKCTQ